MNHIYDTVNRKYNYLNTVNGNYSLNNTVNSKTVDEKINLLLEEENITPEGVSIMLAEGLGDLDSHRYFVLLAKEHNSGRLLEALSLTKEAAKEGKIRTKKAIYFIGILKKWGLKTKFKEGGIDGNR